MTEKEIKQEAIRRGYEGATVESLGGAGNSKVRPSSEWFFTSKTTLRSCNNCLIYNAGFWATILEESSNEPKQLPIFN